MTRTRRVATVESVTPCELFALSRSSLSELLEEFPKMRPVVEHSAISRLLNTCRIVSGIINNVVATLTRLKFV